MTYISLAILTHYLRLEVQTQTLREQTADSAHRCGHASADINRLVIRTVALERQQVRLHDVAHVDKVSRLFTIFKDHRTVAIQQARRKDRTHARVRIRERLPGPIDVEVAQRNRRHSIRPADRKTKLFL